jgi:hypothetical protein
VAVNNTFLVYKKNTINENIKKRMDNIFY